MPYMEPACAKLNLSLDILGKRPDGYHELRMVMQSIDLQDAVSLSVRDRPGLSVATDLSFLPRDETNLAAKAALRFFEALDRPVPGLAIDLKKRIPVCAGMAGGSSDGAAVLRLLRRLYAPEMSREALEAVGALVGSDVPYCVRCGTVLAAGRDADGPPPSPPLLFRSVQAPVFHLHTGALFPRQSAAAPLPP